MVYYENQNLYKNASIAYRAFRSFCRLPLSDYHRRKFIKHSGGYPYTFPNANTLSSTFSNAFTGSRSFQITRAFRLFYGRRFAWRVPGYGYPDP